MLMTLASVQFITIVDFMIIMPLGPQLMRSMHIGPEQFGLVVSSSPSPQESPDLSPRRWSIAWPQSGLIRIGCRLPDRHVPVRAGADLWDAGPGQAADRRFRRHLGGPGAGDYRRRLSRGAARPRDERPHVGYALASIVGVPFGLCLGTRCGWHVPFILLGLSGCPVWGVAAFTLPRLRDHLERAAETGHPLRVAFETFTHPNHLNAFALIVMLMVAGFTVFPYISPFMVSNLGMSEEKLPLLFIAGGVLTLFSAPWIGRLADRYGKLRVFRIVAPVSAVMTLAITNLVSVPDAVAIAVMAGLMVSNTGRMVAAMAMITSSVNA